MRVDVSMTVGKELFEVQHWWVSAPDFAIDALRRQLEAASAIWPELKNYAIVQKKAGKAAAGIAGGNARAAALSPERRSEIAKAGAEARWR